MNAALTWRRRNDAARVEQRAQVSKRRRKESRRWAPGKWPRLGRRAAHSNGWRWDTGASSALITVFAENLAHPVKLFGCKRGGGDYPGFGAAWKHEQEQTGMFVLHGAKISGTSGGTGIPICFFSLFSGTGKARASSDARLADAKLIGADYWLTACILRCGWKTVCNAGAQRFHASSRISLTLRICCVGWGLVYRRDWRGYGRNDVFSRGVRERVSNRDFSFRLRAHGFRWWAWHGTLQGGPITATINFIEHFGRVRGAAFPSEHVAGSGRGVVGAWRHRRWLFWQCCRW